MTEAAVAKQAFSAEHERGLDFMHALEWRCTQLYSTGRLSWQLAVQRLLGGYAHKVMLDCSDGVHSVEVRRRMDCNMVLVPSVAWSSSSHVKVSRLSRSSKDAVAQALLDAVGHGGLIVPRPYAPGIPKDAPDVLAVDDADMLAMRWSLAGCPRSWQMWRC